MNRTLKTVIAGVLSLTMVLCSCMTAFADENVNVQIDHESVTLDTPSPFKVFDGEVNILTLEKDKKYVFDKVEYDSGEYGAFAVWIGDSLKTVTTPVDVCVEGDVNVTSGECVGAVTNYGHNFEAANVSANVVKKDNLPKTITATNAINVFQGGTAVIKGDVSANVDLTLYFGESDYCDVIGIYTDGESKVYVGGDVAVSASRKDASTGNPMSGNDSGVLAIKASADSLIVVEGMVDGKIDCEADTRIYAGEVISDDDAAKVDGFLVGNGTKTFTTDFNVEGDKDDSVMPFGEKTATGNTYYVTMNAGTNKPSFLTITSNDGKKIDSVTGVTVKSYNADGSVTIEVPTTGGMQDLVIKFEVIPEPAPDPAPNPSPDPTPSPTPVPAAKSTIHLAVTSVTSSGNYSADTSTAVVGAWQLDNVAGDWSFLNGGKKITNSWVKAVNPYATGSQPSASWFYFDENGKMLTGWQWITGTDGITRCYYLNPAGGGLLGACLMGGRTPDGYLVDSTGAWIVDGKVQTR